jgi:hypothetical protein
MSRPRLTVDELDLLGDLLAGLLLDDRLVPADAESVRQTVEAVNDLYAEASAA